MRTWGSTSRRYGTSFGTTAEQALAAMEKAKAKGKGAPAPVDHMRGFAELFPELAAWLAANEQGNSFAASLSGRIRDGRLLTDGQLNALKAAAAPKAPAPSCDVSLLDQAFATAREKGIQRPKLRLAGFRLSAGMPGTEHAGAVFVREGEAYLGKVMKGRFLRVRACTDEKEAEVLAAIADPKAAAVAFGQRTGNCAVCGRPLVATASVDLGIGPVCAEKMGW